MKTLRDVLRDADPLRHEPHWSAGERRVSRPVVVTTPFTALRSLQQFVAIASVLVLALLVVAIASVTWRRGAVEVLAAVRFEVRLAEEKPASGLREVVVPGSSRKIYLHQTVVVTNSDIARAEIVPGNSTSTFNVSVELSVEGGTKMRRATENHVGRPVAILIDGDVVAAPIVRDPIGTSAQIDSNFTKAEADRIVGGIIGR